MTADAVNPNHYKFPNGVETRAISQYLTSFGGQALQYVARATRLDGQNKGDEVEDLKKAIKFIEWEIERLEAPVPLKKMGYKLPALDTSETLYYGNGEVLDPEGCAV